MLLANTPLAKWMDANGRTVSGLARELGEERGRIQHYVHRRAFPAGPLLIKLINLTGLSAEDFLPRRTRKRGGKAAA